MGQRPQSYLLRSRRCRVNVPVTPILKYRSLAVLGCALLLGVGVRGQPADTPPPTLDALLANAGTYVLKFIGDFVNVVSEERYVQQASGKETFSRAAGGRGGAVSVIAGWERRELLSDFLLVKLPDLDEWVPFRDVFQVDGKPVREREQRLTKLVLRPTASSLDRAREIVLESARYNIGNLERTINMPLFAINLFQPQFQSRFKYSLGKKDVSLGPDVWIVEFEERVRPTFVIGAGGRFLFASGRVWIQAGTGRIHKTELIFNDSGLRATVTTSFRPDERFRFDVPFEMIEDYTLPDRSRVNGRASYGAFRRFDVTATETTPNLPSRWLTEASTGMVLVEIPRGQFAMGSSPSEAGRSADEEVHDVQVRSFFLGRFEVTRQEWQTVMGDQPSRAAATCGPRCPVDNVSYADVQKFLDRLNARKGSDLRFRLPTEAEWEYACRAGTASPFWGGDTITAAQANYDGRPLELFRGRPVPVGTFETNPWGIADAHGNIAEWTTDWYGPYSADGAEEPRASGNKRVVRGGGWDAGVKAARCAARGSRAPDYRGAGVGFRVAADPITAP